MFPPAVTEKHKTVQYRNLKLIVGTTKKSVAAIPAAWLRRKVAQLIRSSGAFDHVLGDGQIGDLDAEPEQLAMDPRCSP